ncbi:hypothetical protein QQP08_016481 [Theobroma cacao]|nr:hypothetical protein QQP08_016481 [Theobroma cacao]
MRNGFLSPYDCCNGCFHLLFCCSFFFLTLLFLECCEVQICCLAVKRVDGTEWKSGLSSNSLEGYVSSFFLGYLDSSCTQYTNFGWKRFFFSRPVSPHEIIIG